MFRVIFIPIRNITLNINSVGTNLLGPVVLFIIFNTT